MSASEFIKLVKDMRQAQKNYFKSRTTHYLELSKALEAKVDAHIKDVENVQLPIF